MTKVEREIHFKLLVDEIAKDARSQQMKKYTAW